MPTSSTPPPNGLAATRQRSLLRYVFPRAQRRDVGEVAAQMPARPRKRKWIGSVCDLYAPGSALQMLIGAAVGIAVGWGVKAAYGFDNSRTAGAVFWVGFLGECFLRLVKCFDLPLIALNICVGVQVRRQPSGPLRLGGARRAMLSCSGGSERGGRARLWAFASSNVTYRR